MDITNYKQCAAYVNERITDPSMREAIFGIKEVSFRDIKGVGSLYKILKVQFAIVYLKWLNASRGTLNSYTSNHFKKINTVLFSLYKTQNVDLDVIVYIMSEVQRDIIEQKDKSFFYGLLNENVFCEFSKLYGIINEWIRSVQTAEDDKETLLIYLVTLLQSVDGVAGSILNRDDKTLTFIDSVYNLRDVISFDENGDTFLLTNRTYVGNKIQYEYVSIDGLYTKFITKE